MEIRWLGSGGIVCVYAYPSSIDRFLWGRREQQQRPPPPTTPLRRRRRRELVPCRRILCCSLSPPPPVPHDNNTNSTSSTSSLASVVGVPGPPSTSLLLKKRAADLLPELKGTSIFLLGTRSAIKSSLGRLLADALRYYYFDSDDLVAEVCGGESAAESFRENDKKGFRESETEVLKQLSAMGRLVVCAGDGAVQNSTNLGLLRHGISIWIDVPLDTIAKWVLREQIQVSGLEIESEIHFSEVLAQLMAIYEEMNGRYATADATISMQNVATKLGYDQLDSVTMEDMALEVLKEIEKLTRVKKMVEEAGRPF